MMLLFLSIVCYRKDLAVPGIQEWASAPRGTVAREPQLWRRALLSLQLVTCTTIFFKKKSVLRLWVPIQPCTSGIALELHVAEYIKHIFIFFWLKKTAKATGWILFHPTKPVPSHLLLLPPQLGFMAASTVRCKSLTCPRHTATPTYKCAKDNASGVLSTITPVPKGRPGSTSPDWICHLEAGLEPCSPMLQSDAFALSHPAGILGSARFLYLYVYLHAWKCKRNRAGFEPTTQQATDNPRLRALATEPWRCVPFPLRSRGGVSEGLLLEYASF